jgi:hypothetical protein
MKNTLATTLIQHTSPARAKKTGGALVLTALLLCGLVLVCCTAQAQSPTLVCYNSTDTWGTPAAVTSTGTVSTVATGYIVAAITDEEGYLEVKAFQNNCNEAGHVHTENLVKVGAPITAVAAADLDASQIVTAVVDKTGTLQLRTWAVGGSAGIAPLNDGYFSSAATANPSGNTPFLGIAAVSPTAVVTAYQDPNANFILQQFNIPSGEVPAPVGAPLNLSGAISGLCSGTPGPVSFGSASQIAIAAISSSMLVTAVSDASRNMYVDVWFPGKDGTFGTGGQTCVPKIVSGANPGLAIDAGFGWTYDKVGEYSFPEIQYYAVTPIINTAQSFEVLYWNISSTGAISQTASKTAPGLSDNEYEATGTAAAMLPTGVPISAYLQESGNDYDVNVGWYGYTGMFARSEITGDKGGGVYGVSAAEAGASFPHLYLGEGPGTAYFVTGTMTALGNESPMLANEGIFKLCLWSYPVFFSL